MKVLNHAKSVFGSSRQLVVPRGPGRPASLFAPKRPRVVRWLLMHPTEAFIQREDARGANLWLVVPNDAGVFQGAEERDGLRVFIRSRRTST